MNKKTKILAVLTILALCTSLLANELHVPSQDSPTIQAAINAAYDGDTVLVADGTYTGPGNRDIDFLGKAITVRSQSGPQNCIIDCNGSEPEPHCGFYFHNHEDGNSVLQGFTVTNGNTDDGGGIYCMYSSPTINDCVLRANRARYAGGGISYRYSNPTINSCVVQGNQTGDRAGGIFCRDSESTISDSTIIANSARWGGAISWTNSKTTIANCSIRHNWAEYGGGIYAESSHHGTILTIKNCIISGNTAEYDGGGLLCESRHAGEAYRIINCTIVGNLAKGGWLSGGGILTSYTNTTITNCTIWDNLFQQIGPVDNTRTSVTYSDVQGGSEGEGNIDVDPRFALPSDYHLMPDSPCIDAGTNDPCGGLPPADADGGARPLDGNGDAYAVADMGAYEYNSNSACIALSPRTLYFTQNWPRPDPQTLLIRNCGGQALNWQIVEDCPWLEAEPASGQSTGEIDQVAIIVDPNALTHGYNSCSVTVEDPQASNSPVMVTVSTHLGTMLRVPSQDLPTIQAAIDAADHHDIVLVADGTYTGDGNRDLDFKGKPITLCSENGPESSIIDCNGTEDDPHRAFYFFDGQKQDALVDGFTITNGYATGDWPRSCGGAVFCAGSSPTINNCIITGNAAQTAGGIYCEQASPTITNCIISGNSASYQSGAIFWWDRSSPTIKNCILHQNSAKYSGAICCASGKVQISNCIFTENTSIGWGGAVHFLAFTISKITNCTFAGNSAWIGGAICLQNSSSTLANCTITGNTAKKGCGGIYCYHSDLRIANCIIWDNLPPQLLIRGTSSVTYSNLQGGPEGVLVLSDGELNWGPGNIDSDPWFIEPGFWDANGTPQDANDDFWVDGDYRLLAGSPCIDAGDPNYSPELHGIIDLHGSLRLLNGNRDGIPVVDMGAYEYVPPVEVAMHLAPQTLNCHSKGKYLKAHITLPEGFLAEDVAVNEPAIAEPMDVESEYINVLGNKNGPVKIEIVFDRQAFCEALTETGELEITVTGSFVDGLSFSAIDTITIIDRR